MKASQLLLNALSKPRYVKTATSASSRYVKPSLRPCSHPIADGNAVKEGVAIVRKVLAENPSPKGWRTGEIYELALKEPVPEGFKCVLPNGMFSQPPPHIEHPIRSKKFLKDILAHLEGYKDIKLVTETRLKEGASASSSKAPQEQKMFVWKLVDKSLLPKPQEEVVRGPTVSQAIGGHDDIGHLNNRRQRSRRAKWLALTRKYKGVDLGFMTA
ncbi:hypothetical protein BKA70DRAFT_1399976 [Coprinopsis sp. MPI-PUGE-AT-0042]|nr:hypothetical protein BKA70DRAFT_1399976 [Coprinopsis sp. MPI-PUGE-AT-0042]